MRRATYEARGLSARWGNQESVYVVALMRHSLRKVAAAIKQFMTTGDAELWGRVYPLCKGYPFGER